MPLLRHQYLAIAGVGLEFFKSLQRRNQVPLLGPQLRDASKAEAFFTGIDRGGYMAEEALMLAMADHMVTQNSFTRRAAQRILEGWWNVLPLAARRAEAGEDIWYVVGSWDFGHEKQAGPEDPEDKAHWSFVEIGTFEEVIAFIRAEQAEQQKNGDTVDNIAMINFSLIYRKVRQRAVENKLDVTFFPPRDGGV